MKLLLALLLSIPLLATIHDIRTNSITGRVIIESGDTVIIHPNHSLSKVVMPSHVNLVFCKTLDCRNAEVLRLNHRYRTYGITHNIIK